MMKLYLISQDTDCSYETYDSAVVCAPDEDTARNMDPSDGEPMRWDRFPGTGTWCDKPCDVIVKYIGEAAENIEQGVICASFNAG